jgi:hypothetical protein
MFHDKSTSTMRIVLGFNKHTRDRDGGNTVDYQVTQANQPLMPAYFQGQWAIKEIEQQPVMYSTNLGAEMWFQATAASFVCITMLDLARDLPSWIAIKIKPTSPASAA